MYTSVILAMVLAVLAVEWPLEGAAPPPLLTLAATTAVVLTVFVTGLIISAYIAFRGDRLRAGEGAFLRMVGRLGRMYRALLLVAYALVLFGCGWGRLGAEWAALGDWTVPQVAFNLVPYGCLLVAGWASLYRADVQLRLLVSRGTGLGVLGRPWTFGGYVAFMARQYVLVLVVPALVLLGASDLAVHVLPPPWSAAVDLAAVGSAVLLAGPWVRLCWRTEPIPDGPLRRRLLALARRARVRVGEVLIWRTNLSIANGCMIGIWGPLRYVLMTDTLLLTLSAEEVEAVFAHEVGHIKHRHVLLYWAMTAGAMGLALSLGDLVGALTDSLALAGGTMGAVVLGYLFGPFGYLSRRCEQECDLYAVRATLCPVGCSPPDAERYPRPTVAPDDLRQEKGAQDAGAEPAGPSAAAAGEGAAPLAGPAEGAGAGGAGTPSPVADPEALLPVVAADPAAAPTLAAVTSGVGERDTPSAAEAATPPPGPAGLCPHRVAVFVSALRRIARLNATPEDRRGLRHFSIARRRRFLETVAERPALAMEAARRIRRLKAWAWGLSAAALVVSAVWLASAGATAPEPRPPAPGPDDYEWTDLWIARLETPPGLGRRDRGSTVGGPSCLPGAWSPFGLV